VLDLRTGKTKTVVPAHRNYSYADGDIDYEWSPDGKWLAFGFLGDGRWIDDIGVANVASGEIVNMTRSGYDEYRPRWSPDGKALLFYSNRLGRRSHGSWGSEGDVFAIYLTQEAYDKARLTPEEYELEEEDEEDGDDEDGDKKGKRRRGKRKKKKPVEPVRIEFEGSEKRIRRLTLHSAPVAGYAMSPDGEKLVYFARIEEKWDLWLNEIRKASTKRLVAMGADQPGEVEFDEEGETLFVRRGDGILSKVELKRGGESKAKKVPYGAEMIIHAPKEREYIFDHVWRQLKRKFYEPSLHGVAWDGLRRNYVSLLPHINNNHDFAELLSEMLGELNASHTGARFRIPQDGGDKTASLGLLFDPAHDGDGLKVSEVLENGPADLAGEPVPKGAVLTQIDGRALPPTLNPFVLLNRKAKKPTLLTFTTPDGKTLEKVVKPIDGRAERNLLYKRWTKQRSALVEELSKGRIGYVHVRSMNDRSFRHVFQEVLGKHGMKEALVVDTRYNGGGWLHDDLVKFLGGEPYALYHPRGKERGALGGEPRHRWARPVAVVQNESNYSDAHVFPYAFKQLKIGKLIGTPVAGTGTAVWWERQIDPTLVFGIPQVGMVTPAGEYLENLELKPDVEVYNDPVSVAQGRDLQLERAVEVLFEQIGGK
jgi:C-terminal processing protease CtpA/Prc